jgi:hypothetical protein
MFLSICQILLTLQTINHPMASRELVSTDLSSAKKPSARKKYRDKQHDNSDYTKSAGTYTIFPDKLTQVYDFNCH